MANEPKGEGAADGGLSSAPAPVEGPNRDVTIVVCSTCRIEEGTQTSPSPGEQLFKAVCLANQTPANQPSDHDAINIVSTECLGNCKRRLSAAIVSADCWTYVFGDLAISHAEDLLVGARLMKQTDNGLMPWRGRPQSLKSGMVARIPPLRG